MTLRTSIPYVPGLDGLRALAVIAVLLYHAELPWRGTQFSGGFLGVDVFFVLSGYLITSLLVAEWRNGTRIQLAAFWIRRARRLLPAVFALLAAVILYTTLRLHGEVAALRGDVLAALGYMTNWYLILHDESYFESWGRPSVLRHLWSLAIEEQFYIVWPIAFAVGMRLLRRRGLFVAVSIAAVGSALLMALLYQPGADPSRVYYGTDTRAAGLLVGSALALVWLPARDDVGMLATRAVDALGLAGLGALIGMTFLVGETSAVLYRGGFLLIALAAGAVVVATVNRRSLMGAWLGVAPLRWIGQRSYAIYLWHWPVYMFTRPELDVSFSGMPLFLLRIGVTAVLAEASYRLVEMPVRRGALQRAWRKLRAVESPLPRVTAIGMGVSVLALVALVGVNVWRASPEQPLFLSASSDPSLLLADSMQTVEGPGDAKAPVAQPTAVATASRPIDTPVPREPANGGAVPSSCTAACAPATTPTPQPVATAAPTVATAARVTGIGDSVMLGAAPDLRLLLPAFVINAELGRQPSTAVAIARDLKDRGRLGSVVILHLGNNGVFSAGDLDQILTFLADRERVVVLNVSVPRPWEQQTNDMLAANVARYPNAVLIDWRSHSNGHNEYFLEDRVHLSPAGAAAYASFVAGHFAR